MSSGLWHAAHPFQLCTIQVVGTCYLCPFVVKPFLTFLQIIAVVAAIGIDGLIVEFQNHRAYPIKEESVVRHHQQSLITTIQIPLQPLNHLQIQMVRRLIENQQVRISNQNISQGYTLLLSTAQLSHRLLQVTDLQLGENLFGLEHLFLLALMIKARVKYTFRWIKHWRLLQHTYPQVTTEDNLPRVVALFA